MAANIWALIKVIPSVLNIFKQIQELYITEMIEKIELTHVTKEDERNALMEAIINASSNQQIVAHSTTLHRLNNN